jgi:hypothetical protein
MHPGMPLGRKHLRRSRDAPTGGFRPSKNYSYFRLESGGSQLARKSGDVKQLV